MDIGYALLVVAGFLMIYILAILVCISISPDQIDLWETLTYIAAYLTFLWLGLVVIYVMFDRKEVCSDECFDEVCDGVRDERCDGPNLNLIVQSGTFVDEAFSDDRYAAHFNHYR